MIIKCKMCGGDIEFTPGATYGTCEYCGSTSTIPQADDEQKLNRYNRANHFRQQCEFDKALNAYEKLLEQDDNDAEAHWGAVISRFGIEYVEDPATKKRIPTCHRVQVASILADADYLAAVEHAPDETSRDLYKQQAAEIAEIQKGILAISANEKSYDVFICYKETDADGQRTHDSQWAQDIYYGLTEQGYKVFFSRITLEDKLGQQYEPYIFAALNSAKVMVVVGSKPEYFNAVWVKNEWSRYLALMKTDHKRLLIPCYRDMDPYDLPEELSILQSQNMSKIGFMQDLLRGVKKVLDAGQKAEQPNVVRQGGAASAGTGLSPSINSLMERTNLFLEDGDFTNATKYVNRVLDLAPKHAPAYIIQILISKKLTKETELSTLRVSIDDDPRWKKALRFANEQQKQLYLGYAKQIHDNEVYDKKQEEEKEEQEKEKKLLSEYNQALSLIEGKSYPAALLAFEKLGDYQESKRFLQQCIDEYWKIISARLSDLNQSRLCSLQEQVKELTQKSNIIQENINTQQRAIEEAEKQKTELQAQIRILNEEISSLQGLFSSIKKQKLHHNVDILVKKQREIEQEQFTAKDVLSIANIDLRIVRDKLMQAQIAQKSVEDELEKKSRLADEKIVEIAKREVLFKAEKSITFGHYPQKAKGTDHTPIEWKILAREGSNALVISRYALDRQPYNKQQTRVTWEQCTLRTWLNDTFFNNAFTAKEQAAILTTLVKNDKSQCYELVKSADSKLYEKWQCIECNHTNDKIFLLSFAEKIKYFGIKIERAEEAFEMTDYVAKSKTSNCCWLRSPADRPDYAIQVSSYGTGYPTMVSEDGTVCPALWINLDFLLC